MPGQKALPAMLAVVLMDQRLIVIIAPILDLVVDVLIRTSGAIEILDEDELPPSIEPRDRLAIAKALETCVTEARRLTAEIERETRAVLPT